MFLYIVNLAAAELESQINRVLSMEKGFFDTVEVILSLIHEYSKTDKALVRLYHEMTSIGQSSLIETVVSTLEKLAGSEYKEIIRKAQKRGEIRADVARTGADIGTIPYKIFKEMIKHQLTDAGLKKFLEDFKSVKTKEK